MSKKVPYKTDYNLVEKNELISQFILWISVIVSVATFVVSKGNILICKAETIDFLNKINCYLAVAYFVADIVANYLFQLAEAKRREDFFDNSLNTQLAENNSEKYFSNENLNHGITKMGVNSFENSFFSKSVSGKMLTPMLIKSAIVLALFLALALFTDRETLTTALQLALPFTILLQTIRLFLYNKRMKDVFKTYQRIFSSTVDGKKENLIINNMTNYETVLSWACIKLDSKLFEKMNDDLSAKWEDLKKKYNIN